MRKFAIPLSTYSQERLELKETQPNETTGKYGSSDSYLSFPIAISCMICKNARSENEYIVIGRFYTRGRIMRLDERGQTFVIRLVIRL